MRARRVDVPQTEGAAPVFVRAGEERAAADAIETVKSKLGWVGEWAKSAGKFGVGIAALTGIVTAVGHVAGVDVPSATSLLFNGAIVAVGYKPLEWGGAKLCSVAGKGVSWAKEKWAERATKRAEAAELREQEKVRRTRGPEVRDDAPYFDDRPVGEAQGVQPGPAEVTTDEIVEAVRRLAARDFATMNPQATEAPPEIPREQVEAFAGQLAQGVGNPEVDQVLQHIRATVMEMRREQAAAGGAAPGEAEPVARSAQPPQAAEPRDAAPPEPPAAAPRKRRRREPTAKPGEPRQPNATVAPAPQPRTPVRGEGAGYRIVPDEPRA
ncbi:MAG: hypothetical protein ACAI38_16620 [Myxococcota bacterium]|nr:hypothetical protein [Myxococcota bacterium]